MTGWALPEVFVIGTVVAVCLCLGGLDADGSVRVGAVPAGVLHDQDGVADVDPAGHGDRASSAIETLMRWINQPPMVVALGLLALGVVLVLALRPRGSRG